jgi:hypothetical protein
MQRLTLPGYETAQDYFISAEGLQQMLSLPRDAAHSTKNILWTDDFKTELPIRMGKEGPSAIPPTTLIDEFRRVVRQFPDRSALSSKHTGVWVSLS